MSGIARLSLILALAGVVPAVSVAADQAPTFLDAVQVNVVNVEVYVTDKEGRAVTGLAAKDFVLEEDGRKVKVTNFAYVDSLPAMRDLESPPTGEVAPQYVVLYLDDYTIDGGQRRRALEQLRGFVHRERESAVAFAVASYDGVLRMNQPFTYDRDLVLAALRDSAELSPLGVIRQRQRSAVAREALQMLSNIRQLTASEVRDTEVPRYLAELTRQIDGYAERVKELNEASLYALSHLANSLAALPGRKAVIYVSEGLPARPGQELYQAVSETLRGVQQGTVDQSNFEAVDADIRARSGALSAIESSQGRRPKNLGQGPTEELQLLTALANASGVSFYAFKAQGNVGGIEAEFGGAGVELFSPQFKSVREDNLAETLRVLADETGGDAVIGGDLQALLEQARADAGGYYSLGYDPPHSGDAQFHTLKVKLRRRGLKARYRRGYLDKPLAVKAADRTSTALLLGIDDNPLGLTLEVGQARANSEGKGWILPVRLSVPLASVTLTRQGSLYVLEAQVYIAARSAAGDMAPVQEGLLRIEVAAEDFADVRSRTHVTDFELSLRAGRQRLAVGFLDPVAVASSFVSREVAVGPS